MYEPTIASVQQHPLPDWYNDAKFGIFIHWGLYSVPAFAPRTHMDITKLASGEVKMSDTPYAEWYLNSLRNPGSPVQRYHAEKYGAGFAYEDFAPEFNRESQKWDPSSWAGLFQRAGARYAVLTTKHHDGFLLWPSRNPNPRRSGYQATRDIVGEITSAVSAAGLKMGLYYSSLLDWSFQPHPIVGITDLFTNGDPSRQYRNYVESHWLELIERYDPWILWSDIGYPPSYNLPKLFAQYYNRKPDGLVNDRWMQLPPFFYTGIGKFVFDFMAKQSMRKMGQSGGAALPKVPHSDYVTPEYSYFQEATAFKWEACRGIGNSFGYNQTEDEADYLKAPELIRSLVEIVSANGNLLLNVGPRPDGSIPDAQVATLEGIGRWLAANGEAIYGSRPWTRLKDSGADGGEVRYTCKGNALYITATKLPNGRSLVLPGLPAAPGTQAILLETGQLLECSSADGRTAITLPENLCIDAIPVVRLALAG
jgi:alpha-L-fucosidase